MILAKKTTLSSIYAAGMRRDRAIRTFALACCLLTLFFFVLQEQSRGWAASVPRSAASKVPVELDGLVEKATIAANSHRPKALAPFAVSESTNGFAWTMGTTQEWAGDVLAVPAAANQAQVYLAVFHAWHSCESEGDHVHRLLRVGQGWKLGAEILETDTLGVRIRDHRIQAAIDVPHRTATFTDTIQVERSLSGSSGKEQATFGLLRISEDYHLQSLTETEAGANVPFQQEGGVIAFIPPNKPDFRLTLHYAGKVNHRNGDFIHDDEAMLNSYWYPHTARLPATLTVSASAPPAWTTIAQGELVDTHITAEGSSTTTWRNTIPTCYFTLDMGRYRISTRAWHNHTLAVYLMDGKRRSDTFARDCLDTLQNTLDFYEKNFGTYPYSRYTVVETKGPFEGALEAYSFATFGPGTLPEFIPHELSHTWWGGLIPCTYTRSMWNEAFANYSDNLFQRKGKAPSHQDNQAAVDTTRLLEQRKNAAKAYEIVPLSGAHDTENEQENAIGYGKGSQVMRLLEEEIGLPSMFRSLQLFLANHPKGEAAEWPEFEAAVRQATNEDLRWFFAQWIEQKGAPRVRLGDVRVRTEAGASFVEGSIVQEGDLYRLKMPVVIEMKNGTTIHQTVQVQEGTTNFRIPIKSAPDRLRLDPDALVPMAPAPSVPADSDPFTFQFN